MFPFAGGVQEREERQRSLQQSARQMLRHVGQGVLQVQARGQYFGNDI